MKRILIAALLWLIPTISHATKEKTCIVPLDAEKAFELAIGSYSTWGDDISVKKAYADLLESGMIEYNSDRPILYSTNQSFTTFVKRICHDKECDTGDAYGTMDLCIYSTKEHCILIAATKGDDLYCLLVPFVGSTDERYDPFR